MTKTKTISHRDRAVLHAVASGRCVRSIEIGAPLLVDGVYCSDQLVGLRLTAAGFIAADTGSRSVAITASGRAVLEAA